MKSYKDMTKCVLEARDEYVRKKKRRNAIIMRTAPIVLSACFICVFGVRMWGDLRDLPKAPDKIINADTTEPVSTTSSSPVTTAASETTSASAVTSPETVITAVYETRTAAASAAVTIQHGTSHTERQTAPSARTSSPSAAKMTSAVQTAAVTGTTEIAVTAAVTEPTASAAPVIRTTKTSSTTRPVIRTTVISTVRTTAPEFGTTASTAAIVQTTTHGGNNNYAPPERDPNGGSGSGAPGMAVPPIDDPGGGSAGSPPQENTGPPSGGGTAPVVDWYSLPLSKKFEIVSFKNKHYTAVGWYISEDDIGDHLRSRSLKAYPDDDTVVMMPAEIYEIKEVEFGDAIAVKMEENGLYYIYFSILADRQAIMEKVTVLGNDRE